MLSKGDDRMPRLTLFICVQYKGDDGIPRLTLFDHVYYPIAMRKCHSRRYVTVCIVQEPSLHANTDIFLPCVVFKGDYGIP